MSKEKYTLTAKDALRVIGLLVGYVNWATGSKLMVVEKKEKSRDSIKR